jgi:hypothetical protein
MASAIVPAPIAAAVVPAMPSSRIRDGMRRRKPGCQREHRRGPDDAVFRPDHAHVLREPVTPMHLTVGLWQDCGLHSGKSQFTMTGLAATSGALVRRITVRPIGVTSLDFYLR